MKLRSRAIIIKKEDCSLQTNASSKARVLLPDATLSIKQDSESCTLVKQEEAFTLALNSSKMQVETSEEMDKAIKKEETSETKAASGRYVDKLQGEEIN